MTKGIIAHIVAVVALLFSIHTGNAWVALVSAFIFVFTWFPQWRTKMYRLLDKAIGMLKRNRHDSCTPPDL